MVLSRFFMLTTTNVFHYGMLILRQQSFWFYIPRLKTLQPVLPYWPVTVVQPPCFPLFVRCCIPFHWSTLCFFEHYRCFQCNRRISHGFLHVFCHFVAFLEYMNFNCLQVDEIKIKKTIKICQLTDLYCLFYFYFINL